MNKKVQLSYACPIPWEDMKSLDARTRFCSSCKINVRDFTKDNELDTSGAQCGRFRADQVNGINRTFQIKSSQVFAISLATLLGLAPLSGMAQEEPIQTDKQSEQSDSLSTFTIKGLVKDKETEEPLPFANVFVKNENGVVIEGTTTDFDGRYNLQIAISEDDLRKLTIEVQFLGYGKEVKKNIIENQSLATLELNVEFELNGSHEILGDVVIIRSEPPFDPIGTKTFRNEDLKNGER